MKLTTLLHSGSLPRTACLSKTSGSTPTGSGRAAVVVQFERAIPPSPLSLEHGDFDTFMQELEQEPAQVEGLLEARQWVAETFYSEEIHTLRSLRLHQGMTQQQLADRIGTTQPQIVKWERGQVPDPPYSTLTRLCEALQITPNEIFEIIGRMERGRAE